mgnify:CR=1 FL=1
MNSDVQHTISHPATTAARSPATWSSPTADAPIGYGFDLHAGVRVSAHDRDHLERLCRYLVRPPLGNDRLKRLEDGRYSIRLKTAWKDCTSHIVLTGVELVGRVAALIPPSRVHTLRYYGVFAPHANSDAVAARALGMTATPSAQVPRWARIEA